MRDALTKIIVLEYFTFYEGNSGQRTTFLSGIQNTSNWRSKYEVNLLNFSSSFTHIKI